MKFYILTKDSSKGGKFTALYVEFAGIEKALCFEKETLTLLSVLSNISPDYVALQEASYNNKIYLKGV